MRYLSFAPSASSCLFCWLVLPCESSNGDSACAVNLLWAWVDLAGWLRCNDGQLGFQRCRSADGHVDRAVENAGHLRDIDAVVAGVIWGPPRLNEIG